VDEVATVTVQVDALGKFVSDDERIRSEWAVEDRDHSVRLLVVHEQMPLARKPGGVGRVADSEHSSCLATAWEHSDTGASSCVQDSFRRCRSDQRSEKMFGRL
jgi:hypothetical protein